MKRTRLSMIAVLAVIFGLGLAQSASACGGFACWLIFRDGSSLHGTCHILSAAAQQNPGSVLMHMGETTITALGERKALVTVTGYLATEMDVSCADALSAVPGLSNVDSAIVLNSDTGKPLSQSPRYVRNKLTGPDFADQANLEGLGNARYFGFSAKVRRPVPDNTHLTYVFEVTLKAGVSVAEFARSLSTYGVLGTARSNSDGSLNPAHIHMRPLGLTPVTVIDLSQ
jgi:hypothetical protein